jgi:hypothetical protein
MKSIVCLIPFLFAAHAAWALNPHPRIWLDSGMRNDLAAKAASLDTDWLSVLADANSSGTTRLPPVVSIVAATNTSRVQFTTSGTQPFSSGANLVIAGGTGSWAAVNGTVVATVTGANTFTIPVDSSGFGSFAGQALTVFVSSGCAANFMCYTGGYSYQGSAWYRYIVGASLVYQVTGNTAYRDYVIRWLDYINSISAAGITTPVSTDSGYPTRFIAPTVGIAYDWCYSGLSSAQKSATIVTAHLWFDWVSSHAFAISGGDATPNSNYTGGHILGMGIMGYAIYDEDATASALINWASTLWNSAIAQGFSAPVPGNQFSYSSPFGVGVFYSGVTTEFNYVAGHIDRLLEYQLAVKTATGSPLPSAVTSAAKAWATGLLYDLKPDRWRTRTNGTYSGNVSGVFNGALPMTLSYVLSGTSEGGWMQWIFQHLGTPTETTYSPGILNATSDGRLERALFYRPSAPSIDYRATEPTYRFAPGSAFRTFWRSDWTDSSIWFMFHGSAETDGQGYSAGDMELTRGADQLIVNSQNWNGTGDGVTGSPNIFTSGLKSGYTSSLYCDSLGAYFPCTSSGSYWGGQGAWGKYTPPLAQKDSIGYVLADVTNAYDRDYNPTTRAVRYWYRETLAMGDGTQIVWDRVKMLDAAYTKHLRWQLSSAGTPAKTGNVVSNVVGSSAIFIAPVLPVSPSVKIVRNLDNSDTGNPVNWRVEVGDAAGGTDLNSLTVLYATASNGSLPATASITTDANHVGVQVADTTPKIAVFASNVDFTPPGTYVPHTYTSATLTTTHAGTGKYLIAGLAPGSYSVRLNGLALPGYDSASVAVDGTLLFSSKAGDFSISRSSAPANSCDLNSDGVVDGADVQVAINQALGVTPCRFSSPSGVCNVVDVQLILVAALGQGCNVKAVR